MEFEISKKAVVLDGGMIEACTNFSKLAQTRCTVLSDHRALNKE